jgi:nitrogen fixation protein NifX
VNSDRNPAKTPCIASDAGVFFVARKEFVMKVAFTSSTGETIDQHFGQCQSFHIWEIGPEEASQTKVIDGVITEGDEEDRIAARAALLGDCAIVYTMQIGGPAAAKLVAKMIHPMKTTTEVPVAEIVGKLQEVLRGNPPPWLRKAMQRDRAGSFLDD